MRSDRNALDPRGEGGACLHAFNVEAGIDPLSVTMTNGRVDVHEDRRIHHIVARALPGVRALHAVEGDLPSPVLVVEDVAFINRV